MNVYDPIARLYDPWSRSVVEDVSFYVEEALASGGPVVELGIGTGRLGIPIAEAGVPVIGVDTSEGMLAVCRERGEAAGVSGLLDLRVGDLREPPVAERVPLVICPFRAFLHMEDDGDRSRALRGAYELLVPGGRFIFDVFEPLDDGIEETHGRWLEREPGIWERADWDRDSRTLTLNVRGPDAESVLCLSWISPPEWRQLIEEAGFEVEALYSWFDRRPYDGGEDSVWIVRRPK